MRTADGQDFTASNVILATGASVALAEAAGVATTAGTEPYIKSIVTVDSDGRSSVPGIWAAGTTGGVSVHTIVTAGDGARVAVNLISEARGERHVDHDVLPARLTRRRTPTPSLTRRRPPPVPAAVAALVAVAAQGSPEAAAPSGRRRRRHVRAGWRRQRRCVSRRERRLLATSAPDEDCDERPADQHHDADDDQHDGDGEQPIDLDADSGGGVDAGAPVGVHHHDGPVSAPHIPGQCAGLRGRDLGDPERLVTRRRRDRRAVLTFVA